MHRCLCPPLTRDYALPKRGRGRNPKLSRAQSLTACVHRCTLETRVVRSPPTNSQHVRLNVLYCAFCWQLSFVFRDKPIDKLMNPLYKTLPIFMHMATPSASNRRYHCSHASWHTYFHLIQSLSPPYPPLNRPFVLHPPTL